MISEALEASNNMLRAQDKIGGPNRVHKMDKISEDNHPGAGTSHGLVWTLGSLMFNRFIRDQCIDEHGHVASSRRTDNCI